MKTDSDYRKAVEEVFYRPGGTREEMLSEMADLMARLATEARAEAVNANHAVGFRDGFIRGRAEGRREMKAAAISVVQNTGTYCSGCGAIEKAINSLPDLPEGEVKNDMQS